MTRDAWNEYSDSEKETAEATFAALSLRDALLRPSGGEKAARRFGISDLYAWVKTPGHAAPEGLEQALTDDGRLRANLQALLERESLCEFDLAEVASSGDVQHRAAGPWSIRIQASHAIEGRSIVSVELAVESGPTPAAIFAQRPDGRCYKLELPEARNGHIQLLVERDAEFLDAFADPNAKVFLR